MLLFFQNRKFENKFCSGSTSVFTPSVNWRTDVICRDLPDSFLSICIVTGNRSRSGGDSSSVLRSHYYPHYSLSPALSTLRKHDGLLGL